MNARKTLIAVAVAALIPLGSAALANDYGSKEKTGSGATFKQLDTNKDGRISQAEAAADSNLVFSTADTNGDGYIDQAEWKAAMKKQHGTGDQQQSMPSSPNSPNASSETDPNQTPSQQPAGNRPPDTETPRQ
jgi:hypothetical protein